MTMLSTPSAGLPIGVIVPYVGAVADIPTGWALCDGTNGTVDMRNKFVMGGEHDDIGNTGGANEVTPDGSVSVSIHNHTLSNSQQSPHNHMGGVPAWHPQYAAYGSVNYGGAYYGAKAYMTQRYQPYTSSSGGGGAHNHGSNASLSMNQQDNKPAYYQTAYIQRVA